MNPNSMAEDFAKLLHDKDIKEESLFSPGFFTDLLKGSEVEFTHDGEKYSLHLTFDKDIKGRRKVLLVNEAGVALGEIFLYLHTGEWVKGNPSNSTKYEPIFEKLKNSEKNTRIALGVEQTQEDTSKNLLDSLT